MSKKMLKFLVLLLNFSLIFGQNAAISCRFSSQGTNYNCNLSINNPNGLNNFTQINGTHLEGRSDEDVVGVLPEAGSSSINIPSIICSRFRNIRTVVLTNIGLQRVNRNSFNNCKMLSGLYLNDNRINFIESGSFGENPELLNLWIYSNELTTLPENLFFNQSKLLDLDLTENRIADLPANIFRPLTNLQELYLYANQITNIRPQWFDSLENLQFLFLNENQIEELPENAFKGLKNLEVFGLDDNNLKVIHSESFGIHPKLNVIYLMRNQIYAVDELLFNNTEMLNYLFFTGNVCADVDINDALDNREHMMNILEPCFENYRNIGIETTTGTTSTTTEQTTTPACEAGNLDDRVCRIESEIEEFHGNFHNINDELEDLRRQIAELKISCSRS
ncbi:leucine-rich repeat-containing protein 15-like [Chironomus tepperi]|uniref:leucine-rich repeat-containing protein 15-like n=1 Tax=Chironomus tepperi TaxID=113505 RepID=UPI00391F445C